MKPGDRGRIVGIHPWSGYAARFSRYVSTAIGSRPLIHLIADDEHHGREVVLMVPADNWQADNKAANRDQPL
jgi:hypothetical protein